MDTHITPDSIVLGYDGSEPARHAVTWAADQAALEGRPLAIVNAGGEGELRTIGWAGVDGGCSQQLPDLLATSRALVQEAVTLASSTQTGVQVQGVPLLGGARQRLVELSASAHMIVLGSRGRGPFRSTVLGSVSAAVVRSAHCTVVVCRPGHAGALKDGVLVGADGSAESLPVVEYAFRHASLRGLPLTVVHCVTGSVTHPSVPESVVLSDDQELHLILSESVAGLAEKFPDVHVTLQLARGPVEQCLTSGSRPRDLIVVGRHRVSPLLGLVTGATATAVLERSGSTVAVVPEAAPDSEI
ncbi:universal stress protein [Nocardioides sp. Soil796]|uniref:universal stress protein n=1 Tax=Nocardioides sp. Soil796 TaxID=1736412 RepID=UPI000708C47D|nr:universal stress protein [Nocardioides sp. Soil796]KRF18217.1 hypothetical protein ASH02_01195 [Nocardioides sp. Soil796]